jgi:hypothetical protein
MECEFQQLDQELKNKQATLVELVGVPSSVDVIGEEMEEFQQLNQELKNKQATLVAELVVVPSPVDVSDGEELS